MTFRIKQTGINSFIAQVAKTKVHAILGLWFGIDSHPAMSDNFILIWNTENYQSMYCIVDSYDKAAAIIEKYKKFKTDKPQIKKYPVIYDL